MLLISRLINRSGLRIFHSKVFSSVCLFPLNDWTESHKFHSKNISKRKEVKSTIGREARCNCKITFYSFNYKVEPWKYVLYIYGMAYFNCEHFLFVYSIGSAVVTFIGQKQTNKQTEKKSINIYIYTKISILKYVSS